MAGAWHTVAVDMIYYNRNGSQDPSQSGLVLVNDVLSWQNYRNQVSRSSPRLLSLYHHAQSHSGLSSRDLHKRSHTRYPIACQREQIPVPRQRHPTIPRHRHRERVPILRLRRQRNASLIRVHRMRRARQSDQRKVRHWRVARSRDGQCTTNRDACGAHALDRGPLRQRTGAGEQVRWAEDLRIEMVGGASAAKAAAAIDNGGVG